MSKGYRIVTMIVLAALFIGYKYAKEPSKSLLVEDDLDDIPTYRKAPPRPTSDLIERTPASEAYTELYAPPSYAVQDKDGRVFSRQQNYGYESSDQGYEAHDGQNFPSESGGQYLGSYNAAPDNVAAADSSESVSQKDTDPAKAREPAAYTSITPGMGASPTSGADNTYTWGYGDSPDTPEKPQPKVPENSGSGSSVYKELSCSTNIGGGSYSSPQKVSLSCSSAANIRYCIAEDFCCDPDTGQLYTTPIIVGKGPKTYCMSFRGTSFDNTVSSPVTEVLYTFNPALPDLQVAHNKIYYQTTELYGLMSLTSLDFGKAYFSAGVINFKNHDPGVGGLNWTCEERYLDHVSLSSPITNEPMPELDVSGISPASQLDVYFTDINLAYGDNFLTTYVRNGEFLEPSLACSTNKVTLYDFPYFQEYPSHGLAGTNQVREFSGGFSHLGFFEPEVSVFRGPAGVSAESAGSQVLETGMYSVFY